MKITNTENNNSATKEILYKLIQKEFEKSALNQEILQEALQHSYGFYLDFISQGNEQEVSLNLALAEGVSFIQKNHLNSH